MRIIMYEIRKLLNWKILGLVLLISLLFFELFLRFDFDYFPNGRPAADHFHVAEEMINHYGYEMDDAEFLDFKQTYQEEKERAGEYLRSNEDFVEADITTYSQFKAMDTENETLSDLSNEIFFEEGIDVFWELQARDGIIEAYEKKEEIFINETDNIYHPEWQQSIIDSTASNAILPSFVYDNYNNLITRLSILIMISVMIVVGNIFIQDKKNNVMTLQCTTYTGRYLFKKKIIAAMTTAFLITSIYATGFLSLYAHNDTQTFFSSSLHSFDMFNYFWIDITFFQYIIFTIIGVYLIAFVAAAISIFLSRLVGNYISLIGAQVPFIVLLTLLISRYLISDMFSIYYPMYVTIGTYIALIVIGTGSLMWRWRKERRISIV
ncbi:hypothetical protein [Paraliobacillus sp. JSM ZJ581]|uniref:hypothetical protein n=1 Tax=Paraliobacillus sp. JSM ZJ581 TaxID=3342118 RepID=UPI0035A88DE9